MTTRLLPRRDWPGLAGTELESVWPHLPDDAQVIVVEDGGAIVGCWAAYRLVHVEGVWVAPAYRGRSSVQRRLLLGMRNLTRAMHAPTVSTAAVTDDVRGILDGLGATKLPGDHYVLAL